MFLLSHRGRLDLQDAALGDNVDLSGSVFEIIIDPFELRLAGGGHLHSITELHHVLMRATT